jgi:hypothetical protein
MTFAPVVPLGLAIWIALALLAAVVIRQDRRLIAPAAAALLIYPALAFETWWRELLFVLAGHLGELTFAAICLWRGRTGRATQSNGERAAYSCVGWYLLFNHAWLTLGLAAVPSMRTWYEHARSFGIANDYERAAGMLGVSMPNLCAVMFVLTLAVAPAVLYPWRQKERAAG